MKITVEHEIPCDKGREFTCLHAGDFWGYPVCKYHTHRVAPMEKNAPKCTLFDEWLPGEYQKCDKCVAATTERSEALKDD